MYVYISFKYDSEQSELCGVEMCFCKVASFTSDDLNPRILEIGGAEGKGSGSDCVVFQSEDVIADICSPGTLACFSWGCNVHLLKTDFRPKCRCLRFVM